MGMRTEGGVAPVGAGCLLLVAWTLLALPLEASVAQPSNTSHSQEWVVAPGSSLSTVSAALELAQEGDVIRVQAGTYREGTLQVSRSITLVGEGWPVLDGEGTGSILVITAPHVRVSGFVFRGSGVSHTRDHSAILVEGTEGCVLENNRLEENFFGIYLAKVQRCVVEGNTLSAVGTRESSSGNGIHLWDVQETRIEGNRIRGHRDGIYLEFAAGAVIRNNLSEGNLRYGLHFMFSDDSRYEGNTFSRNGAGVAVMYSRRVLMDQNHFTDNWGTASYGLLLKDVQDSQITGNLFRTNTVAVHSEGTDRLTFRGNRFERNGWAIKVMANSQENLFTENNFIENTFDVVTNSRRNYNTFDGNHWSSYKGYDLTGNGVGDVPYRPVRLFSYIVETRPESLILMRSFFVELLEVAERVLPILTPETLVDQNPRIREIRP